MAGLLVDIDQDGTFRVSQWWAGGLPEPVGPEAHRLTWPVGKDDLERLRWYLEDYLRAPFAVYGEEGPRVAQQLSAWGTDVFTAIFGSGPPRDAYMGLRRAQSHFDLVFRSAVPEVLALPWELMSDPARSSAMALDSVAISRSLFGVPLGAPFAVSGTRLRILLIISRPGGAADVGYHMVARPLVARLQALRGEVDLVVLRPPTLDALQGELEKARAAGEPFQVVHFDGHGVLPLSRSTRASDSTTAMSEGLVLFERPSGGPDEVSASNLARVLSTAEVPLVVLNACQSGAIGRELEAAVATRLLKDGAAAVELRVGEYHARPVSGDATPLAS